MPDRSSSGVLALAMALTGLAGCQSVHAPLGVAPRQPVSATQRTAQPLTLSSDETSAIVDGQDMRQLANGVEKVIATSVSGLEVSQDSAGPVIRIKPTEGQGARTPLFVIDGVPLADGFVLTILSRSVERIDLFRDSASTAPYGSRAAHGVVAIATTRRP